MLDFLFYMMIIIYWAKNCDLYQYDYNNNNENEKNLQYN